MKLILSQSNEKYYVNNEAIHVNHVADNIHELSDYIDQIYVVFEYCSNFARLHLVSSFSQQGAIEEVYRYLVEEENDNDPQILDVREVDV